MLNHQYKVCNVMVILTSNGSKSTLMSLLAGRDPGPELLSSVSSFELLLAGHGTVTAIKQHRVKNAFNKKHILISCRRMLSRLS